MFEPQFGCEVTEAFWPKERRSEAESSKALVTDRGFAALKKISDVRVGVEDGYLVVSSMSVCSCLAEKRARDSCHMLHVTTYYDRKYDALT